MSLKLYGFDQSRSLRCLWALCETNLEFDYIPVLFEGDDDNSIKSASYLSKNSQGKVPMLEHDDFILSESLAIVNYIDNLSDMSFIPQDNQTRARYDELTSFIVTELEQPLWTNGKHRFALPEEQRVEGIFATAEFEFNKAINALNSMTDCAPYALGDNFTFADVMLAQTIQWAERFKFEVPQKYLDYRDSMFERDAMKKAMSLIG